MNELLFFEDLLGIEGLEIDRVIYESRNIFLHCHTEASEQVCPSCGTESEGSIRKYQVRQIRDLDISGKEVWLHLQVRQLECSCGRFFQESFNWVDSGKSYTHRQAKFIFECSAKQPFTEAGALMNIQAKQVERMYYSYAKKVLDISSRYAQVRKLGIDELSLRKGKGDYCCVLSDLERGIEIDILPNRKKATLIAHFEQLGTDFCAQIQEVACDMWGPYTDVARECFPQARITIDRFHVVKALNEALDGIRRALRKEFPKQEAFKSLKWSLFKRPDKCSDKDKETLKKAFELAPELEKSYLLRNRFHAIFDQPQTKTQATQCLEKWVQEVERLGEKKWDKFLKTLNNWKEYILNFVESRISNAVTEGLNNLIRYIKRISFAIPNFEHMRIRVLCNSG